MYIDEYAENFGVSMWCFKKYCSFDHMLKCALKCGINIADVWKSLLTLLFRNKENSDYRKQYNDV